MVVVVLLAFNFLTRILHHVNSLTFRNSSRNRPLNDSDEPVVRGHRDV